MTMKVLVADDDPVSRRILESSLHRWGYEVTMACDGIEAWDILHQPEGPRFAILDWSMPGMEGIQICQEIRKNTQKPYTYILLLSAKDQKKHIVQGIEAGADDYLTKPFDHLELRARILAGRRIVELHKELEAARLDLLFKATHDSLTGLLNRQSVLEFLDLELKRVKANNVSVGVIIADVDNFKLINDRFGHPAGDLVLKEVADRMLSSTRNGVDKVGRYGGEEFLIVLPSCTEEGACAIAHRIRNAVKDQPIELAETGLELTCSLGVATWYAETGVPDVDMNDLIQIADTALYKAKGDGRNKVTFMPVLPHIQRKSG